MLSEYGRIKTDNKEYTNLICFTNTKTHIYEMWYLIKINRRWYAVSNSCKRFTKSFKSKNELLNYFNEEYSKENIQYYFLNTKSLNLNGKNMFEYTLNYIKDSFEFVNNVEVKSINDGVNIKKAFLYFNLK